MFSVFSVVCRSDADLRNGISEERRDRTLRTLIRNFYQFHLNEIFYVLRLVVSCVEQPCGYLTTPSWFVCLFKKKRIHRLGPAVSPGPTVDAGQFVCGAERRPGRSAANARRPPARPEICQSIGHFLLPLPGRPADSAAVCSRRRARIQLGISRKFE